MVFPLHEKLLSLPIWSRCPFQFVMAFRKQQQWVNTKAIFYLYPHKGGRLEQFYLKYSCCPSANCPLCAASQGSYLLPITPRKLLATFLIEYCRSCLGNSELKNCTESWCHFNIILETSSLHSINFHSGQYCKFLQLLMCFPTTVFTVPNLKVFRSMLTCLIMLHTHDNTLLSCNDKFYNLPLLLFLYFSN